MSDTVSVGCKMPNGVVLNLDHYEIIDKARGAVRRIDGGASVTLKGVAYKLGKEMPPFVVGGYAITQVPKDFWEAWLVSHKDSSLLNDGLIYAEPTEANARDRSAEQASVPQQFAPLTPKDAEAAGVAEEEERAKKAA